MEENFIKWIIEREGKAQTTAYNYSKALHRISSHYSNHEGNLLDIYAIKDVLLIDKLIKLYGSEGKYSQFGDKGRKTHINAIKTYKRFLNNSPKSKKEVFSLSRGEVPKVKYKNSNNLLLDYFADELKSEAQLMSNTYEVFYCLERSIRELVKSTMTGTYGNDWWSKVDVRVRENVKNNLLYELDTTHTKRSEHRIDYTTFGDLRKIINSDWNAFESKFKRSLNSVNEVMIDLNRIRVSIAHCTPLAQKELNRFEIRVDDWFDLLKA